MPRRLGRAIQVKRLVENGGTNLSYLLYQSGGSGNRMVADMNGIITVTATGVLKHAWAKRSNTAGAGPAQTLKIGSFLYTRQFC